MKQSDSYNKDIDGLRELAAAIGVEISPTMAAELITHVELLLEANTRVNLTSIRDRDAAIRLHALDSVAVLPYVQEAKPGPVADLGSGGGFPGIPIALCSHRSVALVESIAKKAKYLSDAVGSLGLSDRVTVSALRAEEEAIERPQYYSVVVARALSSLPSLVELASPLLKTGGVLIAMKGKAEDIELQAGAVAAAKVGMKQVSLDRYTLPPEGEARSVVVYVKSGRPAIRLPRNIGLAQKKPLA
ncbi:MAG: 16S rRNA (guanine(527)-N(7))-methyltransferase RsmG [Actinomycetota bacterium]|nr:16S rRNA (guanine(527)-N(7))-methyltransferase RsmG [Actinomycetota bacterium]